MAFNGARFHARRAPALRAGAEGSMPLRVNPIDYETRTHMPMGKEITM